MIINSFAVLPTVQIRDAKRVNLRVLLFYYSLLPFQKSENGIRYVIYLAAFTSNELLKT